MNDDINEYVPSVLNPRTVRKNCGDLSLTQNSIVSRCSLSLKRNTLPLRVPKKVNTKVTEHPYKENQQNSVNDITRSPIVLPKKKCAKSIKTAEGKQNSIGVSAIEDIRSKNSIYLSSSPSFDIEFIRNVNINKSVLIELETRKDVPLDPSFGTDIIRNVSRSRSEVTVSSATELEAGSILSDDTAVNQLELPAEEKNFISIAFGVFDCDKLDVTTDNLLLKNFSVSRLNNGFNVECDLIEDSLLSTYNSSCEENMNETRPLPSPVNPLKRSAVSIDLAIKNSKTIEQGEINNILLLKTDSTDKVSHVIIQPPNCKFRKKNIFFNNNKNKLKRYISEKLVSTKKVLNVRHKVGDNLKQLSLDSYLKRDAVANESQETVVLKNIPDVSVEYCDVDKLHAGQEMNRTLGVNDVLRCDGSAQRCGKKEVMGGGGCRKLSAPSQDKVTSRMSSPNARREVHIGEVPRCSSSRSPRRKPPPDVHIPVVARGPATKPPVTPVKNIPHYKIVAGTHFAVDAFSYGEIPNVKHYFLTHFHSDHYSGLKKSFSKNLYCSKITSDLCQTRLGVNPKFINVINQDETKQIDGVDVTAVDANHCPGAIMLIFTLPNGKTILHTGDFRAHPYMESYPTFWNNDIHTVYLDTTYCNPRYDFPTQDESLEMALYLLKQKKVALEKVSKKFASVLIVCGTYTIGKEKFFLGMARRIGCQVWACPEKERVLQAVEGRGCSGVSPPACQLHVLPMRDITLEKLRLYLDSMQGAFSEVVAFKPSGWENGKNAIIEKDCVTIYGIPYSEHSSFSEMIRFIKFLKPKQVVPTVDITGGIKSVQKFFPCPLVYRDSQSQCRMTDFFSIQNKQHGSAVT